MVDLLSDCGRVSHGCCRRCSENREVHTTVSPMFHEMGIIREIIVLPMFEDQYAIILEQSFLKDKAGDLWQFFQSVRGIGKDEIEPLLTRFDEAEHVTAKGHTDIGAEFLQTFLDESVMVTVLFYADDMGTPPRHQFE